MCQCTKFYRKEEKLLLCPLSCPFNTKLHKQSRMTLVPSSFLERSGVQVSVCGNDASEVLDDWSIAKKTRELLTKFAPGTIKAAVCANKNVYAFAFALYLNGNSTYNKSIPGRKTSFVFALSFCINGPI